MAMRKRGGMGRGRSKETRKFIKRIEAADGEVKLTANGHLKVTGPDGGGDRGQLDQLRSRGRTGPPHRGA